MPMIFDDKPIRSWTTKHAANAAAWWARLESPTEKQMFGQIVFADRPGPKAPLRPTTPDQIERLIDFILGSDALRAIVSAEINEEITRVTDQLRESTSVRLQVAVENAPPAAPAPAAKATPPPPRPEPVKKPEPKPEPAKKPEPKPEPAKKPEPKPGSAKKPEPSKKAEAPAALAKSDPAAKPGKDEKAAKAKDEKPARGRKKA